MPRVDSALQKLLTSEFVPALSQPVLQLQQLVRSGELRTETLTEIVRSEPGLCTRLLKAASDSIFAVRYIADSIELAISLLGISHVRMLALAFGLSGHRQCLSQQARICHRRIWRQVLTQAATAERLAQQATAADGADWLLAGLLQDFGRLVMLAADPDRYLRQVVQPSCEVSLEYLEQIPLDRAADRGELNRLLTLAFGFPPDRIVSALADIDLRAMQLGYCFSVEIDPSDSLEHIILEADQPDKYASPGSEPQGLESFQHQGLSN